MYSSTQKSQAYGERVASKSLRGFATGYNDIAPDRCALAASCREQFDTLKRNRSALSQSSHGLRGAEQERVRQIIENMNREIGDLARMLEANARAAFEEVFVQVANKRLPKDAFLIIVEEARTIWRAEGHANHLPDGDTKARKEVSKKAFNKRVDEWGKVT